MKLFLSFLFLFLFTQTLPAQINGLFIEVGGSYFQSPGNAYQKQFAFRNSAGLLLGNNWAVGMKMHHIYYENSLTDGDYMQIVGPFGRWGLRTEPFRVYLEAGINWGNYRGQEVFYHAYKERGLWYVSFGGAMEIRIVKGLFFELGLTSHEIINRPKPTFGFDSYVLGLVVNLDRRKAFVRRR